MKSLKIGIIQTISQKNKDHILLFKLYFTILKVLNRLSLIGVQFERRENGAGVKSRDK